MKRNLSAIYMTKYDKTIKLYKQLNSIENQFSGMANKMDKEDKIAVVVEKYQK